jgi:hypothetical protein
VFYITTACVLHVSPTSEKTEKVNGLQSIKVYRRWTHRPRYIAYVGHDDQGTYRKPLTSFVDTSVGDIVTASVCSVKVVSNEKQEGGLESRQFTQH